VLRAAFEESNLTQTSLGEMIGVSQSQVSKYLLAKRALNVDELDLMCTVLGLDIAAVVRTAKNDAVQREVQDASGRENPRSE
jgi:transcriptional regulator with XRE-family HTH domain